ncbi:MAG: prolyl oligopeptidase family serine peptidase [Chloroflexota bacterium]
MSPKRIAPYGSWPSPITAQLCADAEMLVSQTWISDGSEYWVESRPKEGGRSVIVRLGPGGPEDVTPEGFSARTRVHEYGGGAYTVRGGTVYFSNYFDHRVYRQDTGRPPRAITPEPPSPGGLRYADLVLTPDGRQLICVRERHLPDGRVLNDIVSLPADGSAPPRMLLSGRDFYASPRIDPSGRRLAWLSWDHPLLPWVGTELWLGELTPDGSVRRPRRVAGGPQESITDLKWSPDGVLHLVSDRSGWWNLYAERDGDLHPLAPMEADFAYPQWLFGLSRYAFLSGDRIACVYSRDGFDHLAVLHPSGRLERIDTGVTSFYTPHLVSDGGERLLFVGGGPSLARSVIRFDLKTRRLDVLRDSIPQPLDPSYFSPPHPITFETGGGRCAHALFYRPHNPECQGPPGEKPPLVVVVHGGPTAAAPSHVDLETQYFTTRGLAVVLVNYGGSAGYGRVYRERLKGQWGIVDVEDCIYAARHLVDQDEVDGRRLAIRGGSAGGYTTLRALTCSNAFSAGVSLYGVTDLAAFDKETHKFEAHYNEWLIGPQPAARHLYHERSPLPYADRIRTPVLLFQGLDDRIVLPAQAETMVQALHRNRVPHAYLAFEGEGHGFRREESLRRCLEAEFYFYARVFGFEPAEHIEPILIEFL